MYNNQVTNIDESPLNINKSPIVIQTSSRQLVLYVCILLVLLLLVPLLDFCLYTCFEVLKKSYY